jgi:ABC-type sugar transport system ATPase subunit
LHATGERDVVVGIRPAAVRLADTGIPATVELIENLGDAAVLDLVFAGRPIRARVGDGRVPREGERVFIGARPEDIHLFDAASRKRL